MHITLIILIAIIFILGMSAVFFGLNVSRKRWNFKNSEKLNGKNRESIIKEANHRLAVNPKDPTALNALANLYYNEGVYKKAMRTFQLLLEQGDTSPLLDNETLNLHYGISAMHCKRWSEAYNALIIARGKAPQSYEINFSLGKIEYFRGNTTRAIKFLKKALQINPVELDTHQILGQCYFKSKHYREASHHLSKIIEKEKATPEIFFAFARCEYEGSRLESAHKFFRQLLTDPECGASSSLYSGNIFSKKKEWDEAVADYQIGLKHKHISNELKIELEYCLATAYSNMNKISKALALYYNVYLTDPGYKDIQMQIEQHRELNSNKNLRIYLLTPITSFISMTHKIVQAIFPKAKIDVTDVNFKRSDYIDLIATVKTKKREDIVLFRFIRTGSTIGELFIRDFYSRLKELHADRGVCLMPGNYSLESMHFVEARPIELWNKEQLLKILKNIDTSNINIDES